MFQVNNKATRMTSTEFVLLRLLWILKKNHQINLLFIKYFEHALACYSPSKCEPASSLNIFFFFFFELQMLLISSRFFGERDMDYFSCNKNIIHHLISPILSMFIGQVWRRVEYNRMWLAFLILYDNVIGWLLASS